MFLGNNPFWRSKMINFHKIISMISGLTGFSFIFYALALVLSNLGAKLTQDGYPLDSAAKIVFLTVCGLALLAACIYFQYSPDYHLKEMQIREKRNYDRIFGGR
jgi:hypothetical protein